jgi:hypothetical protein
MAARAVSVAERPVAVWVAIPDVPGVARVRRRLELSDVLHRITLNIGMSGAIEIFWFSFLHQRLLPVMIF